MNILLQWSPFLPPASSVNAANVDYLYGFIFWLSVVLFFLVIGPAAWFMYKYRLKPGEEAKPTPRITHHLGLELTWSVIPLILLLIIGVWSFWDFMALAIAPAEAEEIYVTGYKWGWRFEHRNGTKELNELHLPEGKTIKLVMTSEDVIHSFFIPDFRVKHDLPPGRYTSLWFTPIGVGTHQVFCTEYCGDGHSGMLAKVFVMPPSAYKVWEEKGPEKPDGLPLEEWGKQLFIGKSCNTCHTIDGTKLTGPSLKGVAGTPQRLTTGESPIADDEYLRESIMEPGKKIVEGFSPVMPSFQGLVKQNEMTALIAYIKSLK
jgi:cytochrome c oxidase subunit II